MAKPRVTATDRLSNVISVVDLGHRTGLLSVERNVGLMLEEGEIYFAAGTPIYATLGLLHGQDALAELARWNDCRFCFDPHAPQPIPNIAGVLPALDRSSPTGFGYQYNPPAGPNNTPPGGISPAASGVYPGVYPAAYPNGSYPPGGQPFPGQPGPVSPPAPGSWQSPASGYPSGGLGGISGASGANPGASNANWAASSGGFGSGPLNSEMSGGFGGAGANANALSPRPATGNGMGMGADPNMQAHLQRRPRRTPDVRDLINVVTNYNLTRAHRTVLLLADGEHSVLDLARLSGKPVDEVASLLGELEGRGLVYYYQ